MADESRSQIMADIAETPEFKAAVAKAAADAVTTVMAALKEGAAPAPGLESDKAVLSALAVQLAELTGQGSGRRYVAPAILRQREEARERMVKFIIAARESGTPPAYRLTQKVLLDFQLIDPFWIAPDHTARPTEIDWFGVPNEAMVPLNGTAEKIHKAFMESIGSIEKVVPEQALGVTPNGLTVKGRAVPKRRGDDGQPAMFGETVHANIDNQQGGVAIHHKDQRSTKSINVLGTIAPPAQQNA